MLNKNTLMVCLTTFQAASACCAAYWFGKSDNWQNPEALAGTAGSCLALAGEGVLLFKHRRKIEAEMDPQTGERKLLAALFLLGIMITACLAADFAEIGSSGHPPHPIKGLKPVLEIGIESGVAAFLLALQLFFACRAKQNQGYSPARISDTTYEGF